MSKIFFLIFFLVFSLSAFAKDSGSKDDMSFKIVSFVFLVAALVLAIWKLKGTYKK